MAEPVPTGSADDDDLEPIAASYIVPQDRKDEALTDHTALDLYIGRTAQPDEFQLIGKGIRGGQGTTWRARYLGATLENPPIRAIKELTAPEDQQTWPSAADKQRWQDQRHSIQGLRNDHLIHVHDLFFGPPPHSPGTCDPVPGREYDTPYLLMDWIEGPTLHELIDAGDGPDGGTGLRRRLGYVCDLAEALTVLHSTGRDGNPMVHRDIKPANVMIDEELGAVLVDLGTMRSLIDGVDERGMISDEYTAPEVRAHPFEPRTFASDLYSLAAVAYFCVTGNDPGNEPIEELKPVLVAAMKVHEVINSQDASKHLLQMLSPVPEERPSDAQAWAEQLRELARTVHDPPPPLPRRVILMRRGLAGAAATALLVVVGFGVAQLADRPPSIRDTKPLSLADLKAFGQTNEYEATALGTNVNISPPTGYNRYAHLWGLYMPGNYCAETIEFDAQVGPHDTGDFGYAVIPRSDLEDNQPQGYSIQYEWEAADMNPTNPGSYVRPALLPSGAWKGSDPRPAPNITNLQHVKVTAVGTYITVTISPAAGVPKLQDAPFTVSYEQPPDFICGGVALRAWGAPVTFTHVQLTGA